MGYSDLITVTILFKGSDRESLQSIVKHPSSRSETDVLFNYFWVLNGSADVVAFEASCGHGRLMPWDFGWGGLGKWVESIWKIPLDKTDKL